VRVALMLKKARDGYAQDWGDSTDPVTVAFRTDGGHVSCSQHEVERCHGRPEDSQGREVLGCGGEHYVRSAMLRMPPRQQARYFCDRHIPTTLPGVAATITTRNRAFEKLQIGGDLQARVMSEHVVDSCRRSADARTYFCVKHLEDAPRSHLLARPACGLQTLRNALILRTMSSRDRWWLTYPQHTSARHQSVRGRVTSFFELRKSNPRADARVLSRKAPTSIFAIDKASVAFRSC
jgi:hypothetical protein